MNRNHHIARRGLTLIELLCALALLGLLMGGLSAWLTIAIRDVPAIRARLQFESAAQAAARRITEDLLSGDFDDAKGERRIAIDESRLAILTRSLDRVDRGDGRIQHEYRVEDDQLVVIESTPGTAGESRRRTLLGEIAQVRFELLSDQDLIESEGVLTIEFRSTRGQRISRTVRWRR